MSSRSPTGFSTSFTFSFSFVLDFIIFVVIVIVNFAFMKNPLIEQSKYTNTEQYSKKYKFIQQENMFSRCKTKEMKKSCELWDREKEHNERKEQTKRTENEKKKLIEKRIL